MVLRGTATGHLQNGKEGEKGAWQSVAVPCYTSSFTWQVNKAAWQRGSCHLGNPHNLSMCSLTETQEIGVAQTSIGMSLLGSEVSCVVKKCL